MPDAACQRTPSVVAEHAQAALCCHGCVLLPQAIQRIGHWLLDSFGTAYIVPSFNPEALLALGFWPGAAQKDFRGFWAERFHVAVPDELVQLVMPGLDRLQAWADEQQQAAATGKRAGRVAPEAGTTAQVLRVLAVVLVQDALELAADYNNNPIHALLLQNSTFRCIDGVVAVGQESASCTSGRGVINVGYSLCASCCAPTYMLHVCTALLRRSPVTTITQATARGLHQLQKAGRL